MIILTLAAALLLDPSPKQKSTSQAVRPVAEVTQGWVEGRTLAAWRSPWSARQGRVDG